MSTFAITPSSSMGRLSNDAFLAGLDKHFNKVRTVGSLYITFKRYKPEGGKHGVPKDKVGEASCLVRAKLGNKGISTLVMQKDVGRFQAALATMMKGNMDALKKPEKEKKKKEKKDKAAAQ